MKLTCSLEEQHIAVVGAKNSGKSALFNVLTGSGAHVGNYPGVTTHIEACKLVPELARIAGASVTVLDMPGLSSLNAYSVEEAETLECLLGGELELLVNVVDAGNLEMGLYLSLQLLELNIPMVVALNMMDEAAANGVTVDTELLARELRVPVVPISAAKEQGITSLMEQVAAQMGAPVAPRSRIDFCSGDLHKALHSICHTLELPARQQGVPLRYAASKFIAHDEAIAAQLDVEPEDRHIIAEIIAHLEKDTGMSGEVVLATERYRYVDSLCARCVHRRSRSREQERSDRLDSVLTHRIWGIPLFLCVIALVFWLTFSVVGGPLQGLLEQGFEWFGDAVGSAMLAAGVSHWLYDLVVNGVIAGVCSVLSFLPIIMVLFFLLSFLEDSGYMTRAAYMMDKLLRKIGLSGRSFAPLIVGFGCNVPAIIATRTLPSERDRKLTVILAPFMSCSAKLPVYGMVTAAFFGGSAALVMVSLYLLGILVAVGLSLLLSKTVFKGDAMMYVMELPSYRVPALHDVCRHMWINAAEFVKKAFTIIFVGTVVIWFMQNFDTSFNPVSDASSSILAAIGTWMAPVLAPIGLDSWQATTGLLAGLAAKEAIVSTLAVLTGGAGAAALSSVFTPLTAYVFLVFILLYVPCLATFATTRKELGSTWQALLCVCMQILIAYLVCFAIYRVGLLFF